MNNWQWYKNKLVNKKLLFLLCIVFLSSFLRLFWLDKFPSGISGDELGYILNAKAIALTGKDITGTWNPLSAFLFNYPPGQSQAELQYFLFLPVVGFTNFSLLTARLTDALIGVGIVLMIYLLTKELLNEDIAVIAGFIAAINPWLVYNGRTAYEMNPSMFFYLCSIYFILKLKGWKILFTLIFLLLAFYSYIATKVVILPFVIITCIFTFYVVNKQKFFRQYLILILSSLFLIASFFLLLKLHPSSSRISEIISIHAPEITKTVNDTRKVSMLNPFTNILVNKFTITGKILIEKFYNAISEDYLFLYGDSFFSIWQQGLFYYIDGLFFLAGLLYLFAKNRKVFFLLASCIILSLLPQLLHKTTTDNFTPHITLLFPFMIIVIAYGIWEVSHVFVKQPLYSYIIIGFAYFILLINFLNIYFYQQPLQGYFDFPIRLMSRYASLANPTNKKILVFSPRSNDTFNKYLFYSNSYNKNTVSSVRNDFLKGTTKINNIEFVGCDKTINPSKMSAIVLYDYECGSLNKEYHHLSIPQLSDGRETYRIYNDILCNKNISGVNPNYLTPNDFSIENLPVQAFCRKFINFGSQ